MKKENLKFLKEWNASTDEEKWNIVLNEHKKLGLYLFLDYDSIVVMKRDDDEVYLDFNEPAGCISGIYVLSKQLGIDIEYAE